MKEPTVNFFLNVLSVILGIAITFMIQGIIDRTREHRNIRSALELVRSELTTNMDDIGLITGFVLDERKSASYVLSHEDDLASCPGDSIDYHTGVIFADVSLTLSNDALELLKMSSLFQGLGDNPLSMKIIRAYDSCESALSVFNRILSNREDAFGQSTSLRKVLGTEKGHSYLQRLSCLPDPKVLMDISDIEEAILGIDVYLHRKQSSR